jgi:CBS domain-containing protein
MPAGTFTHSSRRWNILAATENYIGALELPTGQCVPRTEPRCDHGRIDMSATGLDVFDKTLQTTNRHLDPHQVGKVRRALPENIRLVADRSGGPTLRTCRLTRPRRPNSCIGSQALQHVRRNAMQVSEAMTNDVKIANPNQSIRDAARLMAQIDAGVLPVGENDRLVGMITDRDIAIRAVGADKGPRTPIREIMSKEVMYCFEDDDLDDIVQNMADIKLRRLPVLDHEKRLVGILSLGDIALTDGAASAGSALCGISEPGGEHSQSMDGARGMREP